MTTSNGGRKVIPQTLSHILSGWAGPLKVFLRAKAIPDMGRSRKMEENDSISRNFQWQPEPLGGFCLKFMKFEIASAIHARLGIFLEKILPIHLH